MKAFVFPGQGAQFTGMGKDLFEASTIAKEMFHQANEILGFDITAIMFGEDAGKLKQTKVTQPAIFIHSVILAYVLSSLKFTSSLPGLISDFQFFTFISVFSIKLSFSLVVLYHYAALVSYL